ncbi:MAG TPA: hypothetical protein VII49_08250 [Rhizomicrobium sp.]
MRLFGAIAFAAVASASVAYAADDPFANLFSNTLVYTSPKHVVMKVLVQKDGTWTSTASDNKTDNGAWATLGNYVCISDAAMPKAKPDCDKIKPRNIGDKWTQKMRNGTVDKVTLVSGR